MSQATRLMPYLLAALLLVPATAMAQTPKKSSKVAETPSKKAKPKTAKKAKKVKTVKRTRKPRVLPNTITRPFDASLVKDRIQFATDGKGHYLAYLPLALQKKAPKGYPNSSGLFYSPDGTNFYRNHSNRSARGKLRWSLNFYDGRHPENGALHRTSVVVTEDDGATMEVRCDKLRQPYKRLAGAALAEIQKKATFYGQFWNRKFVALARDDRGNYYYVDNARYPAKSSDFRVYRGMRGMMKIQPLKGVADDSAGHVFSTKSGSLRLVVGRQHANTGGVGAEWVRRKKRTPLTSLGQWANSILVFKELGPYIGQRLGTPCDDI